MLRAFYIIILAMAQGLLFAIFAGIIWNIIIFLLGIEFGKGSFGREAVTFLFIIFGVIWGVILSWWGIRNP
jgi:hypothetical protein